MKVAGLFANEKWESLLSNKISLLVITSIVILVKLVSLSYSGGLNT